MHPQSGNDCKLFKNGVLVQLVRMPPCHGGGHGFESHTHRIKGPADLCGAFLCLHEKQFAIFRQWPELVIDHQLDIVYV